MQNTDAIPTDRASALEALAAQQREELVPELPKRLHDRAWRSSVIRAIASYDESGLGRLLLNNYSDFNSKEKLEAIHQLVSRHGYGWQLTQALKAHRVPRRAVPPAVARQLRRVAGSGFVECWGPIDQLDRMSVVWGKRD